MAKKFTLIFCHTVSFYRAFNPDYNIYRETKDYTVWTSNSPLPLFSPSWQRILTGSMPYTLHKRLNCAMPLHTLTVSPPKKARYVQFVAESFHGTARGACALLQYIGFGSYVKPVPAGVQVGWGNVMVSRRAIPAAGVQIGRSRARISRGAVRLPSG